MIGIPFALSLSGMITGIVLLIVMGFFTDYSIRLLVRLSEVTGCKSYPALCTYYGGLKACVTPVLGCVLVARESAAAHFFSAATHTSPTCLSCVNRTTVGTTDLHSAACVGVCMCVSVSVCVCVCACVRADVRIRRSVHMAVRCSCHSLSRDTNCTRQHATHSHRNQLDSPTIPPEPHTLIRFPNARTLARY
jgi:hypothetical protein